MNFFIDYAYLRLYNACKLIVKENTAMYSEDAYLSSIFWMRVKRVFIMIALSIIGCVIGVVISSYLINVLNFSTSLRIILIAGLTIGFFFIGVIFTSSISKEILDAYWRIAALRKLNAISKKLDSIQMSEAKSNSPEQMTLFENFPRSFINTTPNEEVQNNVTMFEDTPIDNDKKETPVKENKKFNFNMSNIKVTKPEAKRSRIEPKNRPNKKVNNVTNNNSETGKRFEESLNPYKF